MNYLTDKRVFIMDSGASNIPSLLKSSGCIFYFAGNQVEIIENAKQFNPDLIIGDFFRKNPEQIIGQLREDPQLSNTPLILCTERKWIANMIRRINGNVNDYLVKPYGKEETEARIERVLKRYETILNSNPLSHLPGNISIKSAVTRRLETNQGFSLTYLDLDNFKSFNDYYGYSKGDEVIKFVADLLRSENSLHQEAKDNFVGHIGGDDFVIIRSIEGINNFCESFIHTFDKEILRFYSDKELENGYIITCNRQNDIQKFPIMTVSMACVIVESGSNMHFGEISLRGSEIKKYLKQLTGSNFLIDRRKKQEKTDLFHLHAS